MSEKTAKILFFITMIIGVPMILWFGYSGKTDQANSAPVIAEKHEKETKL